MVSGIVGITRWKINILLITMNHLNFLFLLLGLIRITKAQRSLASKDGLPLLNFDGFNVSSPPRNQVYKPVCFSPDRPRRVELLPYNEDDCKIITRQLLSDKDERVRPRIYSSGPAAVAEHRRLPYLWEHMDCSYVLTAAPGQKSLTVRYSDFDIALMAGKVQKECGNTDIPLGGFQPFHGHRGERMALVVERSVHGRDDSEAADDGYSIQEAAQLPFNVTTPNVRVDTFVGCLPSKPAHDNEVDISKCIDLVHELRTGPKSLSQNTYSNDRRSTGRIVPYRWTWRDCRIMLLPAERDKPRSERFSEYQIAEHAAKIIKKCLIEIPGPAIGGLVNVLASPLETESHFYIRLDSPHNGLPVLSTANISTEQGAAG